jgi:GH25 family lysozyme M1 (1,4-beta-N-acetylmuramidase)
MATCRGIDVSVYQGVQDWAARKAEGVVFAFAKASEGIHTRDAHFTEHITGIIAAGLVPGAYHFAWVNQDVAAEAANYIAAVKPHAGVGFVHWLDLERRSDGSNYAGVTAAQIKTWASAWIAAVSAAFPGQRVGIYTAGSDLSAGHVPAGVTLWYPAYPWTGAASYGQAEAHAKPSPSGRTPMFWQFTSTPIDRSICYLSEPALRAWAAGTETPVTATDDTVKALGGTLLGINSLTEKDPKGNPVPHGAGYYLAHIHYDVLLIKANEAAQTAAITALATALAKVDAAVDPVALVAEVKAAIETGVTDALNSITVHVNASTS